MRLIDADALADKLGVSDEDIEFREMLNEAPTVDAVPVVRCKDCKYRDEQTANCSRFRNGWYVQSNSFCSWEERKEE